MEGWTLFCVSGPWMERIFGAKVIRLKRKFTFLSTNQGFGASFSFFGARARSKGADFLLLGAEIREIGAGNQGFEQKFRF
ncbi:hypothetical protein SAMN05877753_102154 [Bacillus oleivorans]|uniref:Uncharacterized protein n=1 Tax=Bacillus oleivorans TaxID=1448271 RepID=A0A285CKB2_9BACI|nr:hypothetical protein SAMN05877753_102154 [Bacillus oleivorans]